MRPLINGLRERTLVFELAFPIRDSWCPAPALHHLSVAARQWADRAGYHAPHHWLLNKKLLIKAPVLQKHSLVLNLAQRVHSKLAEVQTNPLFFFFNEFWVKK